MVRVAGESSRTSRYLNLSRAGANDPVIICYESSGEGTPVLCVPGLGDTSWVWRKIVPTLSSMHRVIVMEPRGHGRSSSPPGKYTLTEMAGDIGALVARLELSRPVLIGHGLGAKAALMLAVEQPHLPGALILISTGAAPAAKSVRRGVAERIHLVEAGDMQEAYRNRKSEGREPRGMTPMERAEHHRLFLRNDASGYSSAGYAELLAPDLTERLCKVSCAVLAITGEEDPEFHEDAQILSARIRRCRSVLIEGAGRYVQLDRPEAVLAIAHDFFRKHHLSVAKSTEDNHEPID